MLLNATQSVLLQTFLLFINKDNDNANEIIVPQENTNDMTEQCYGMYGCYKMTYPWTDESLRPVSYVPQAPEAVDPKYCLYTRHNEDRCQHLDINNTETLFRSFMMSDHRVFVITHGFLENGHKDWIQAMKRELLKHIDGSVVVVDWSSGSGPPYPQAVANIRLIGAMTAHLLNNLIIFLGIPPEHIHFIGHSLGAHMAAYAGQTLHSEFGYKLGRITGLDPAEPHFSKTDPIMRLDPTDADFVDVIHTDAGPFIVSGGLGILQPIGHVDFYPNGGIEQPGCDTGVMTYMGREMGSFYRGLRKMLSCNHIRSYQYFIESINPNNCYFMGTECDSWEHFLNGTCFDCTAGNKCPFQTNIGLHADTYLRKGTGYGSALRLPPPRTHVKLYMITGPEGPFCRHHYHIVWKISDSCKSMLHGGEVGMIWLTIHGENSSTEIKLSQVVQYYEPGETYHTTVAGNPIDKLESVTLRWEYHTSPWNPLTWRLIETPRIYIAWMQIESLEHKGRMTVCPEDGRPVTSRKALPLEKRTESNMCNINTTPRKLSECSENIH